MTTRFPSPPPKYINNANRSPDQSFEHHSNVNTDLHDIHSQPNPRALTPYLTLPHLLSLTWLASPVISLLFVAFRLVESTGTAQESVADAKSTLMNSCLAAQRAASAAASMPRYMAISTNHGIVEAVNATIIASRDTMILCLTIVETIIEFMIDTYRSTFFCFLELVIRGGLAILIGAVQEISDFVTGSLNTIRTSIQNDVAAANNVIAAAVAAINKVTNIVKVNLSVPQFTIPSLNALNNVTIPTDFENSLIQLNNSLPTLDGLRTTLDSIIEKPFNIVKADITSAFDSISFNSSLFTVPQEHSLSFCDSMNVGFIDDLNRDIVRLARLAAGLLVIVVLCIIGINCFVQWWKWKAKLRHLEYMRDAWSTDNTVTHSYSGRDRGTPSLTMTDHNLMVLLNTAEHPLISKWLNRLTNALKLTPSQHINLRFFASYVFHPPALACLLVGVFGLLSVQIQLAAIGPLRAHYNELVNATVSDFSNSIAFQINKGMANSSTEYAQGINTQIFAVQDTINNDVFGWVNTTTTVLNDTIVAFYQELQDIVNSTLGGTVLESPAQEFLKCMIGNKVQSIEKALTFLHDNLQVNITPVPIDVLMLSNGTVDEVTRPIAFAAVGGNSPSNNNSSSSHEQGLVGKVISRYVASLKKERFLFSIFLLLWLIVAFIALFIIAWHSYGVEWVEERKRIKFQREKEGHITPWYHDHQDHQRAGSPEGEVTLANEAPSVRRMSPADPVPNERRFLGTLEDEIKTPTTEIDLRSFTPLATPGPRNSGFVVTNASKNDSFAGLPMTKEGDTSRWDWEEEDERKESRWSIWKSVGTKLRNDNRRADRMMDSIVYPPRDPEPPVHSKQAAGTSGSGWFSKLAFWRSQPVDDNESLTDDTHERHEALNVTNFLPPSPGPAPVITRSPPTPSHSQKPSFAVPPQPRRAQQDFPRSVDSSTGALGSTPPDVNELHDNNDDDQRISVNPSIPIHYHFVSQRKQYLPSLPPPQPMERKTSIMDRPRPPRESNPFLDMRRVSVGPSMFPPPGLLASRERTRGDMNRRPAPVGTGTNGDPFNTPFDDPRSPSTPASGRYPRAI